MQEQRPDMWNIQSFSTFVPKASPREIFIFTLILKSDIHLGGHPIIMVSGKLIKPGPDSFHIIPDVI